jgi:molybdenum-dependent DNA-binding transcriptional regulator ModE
MENKQTPVEWLVQELKLTESMYKHTKDVLEQANKMFEEQIKEAYSRGKSAGWYTANQLAEPKHNSAEEYYEQTYIINQQYDKEENK